MRTEAPVGLGWLGVILFCVLLALTMATARVEASQIVWGSSSPLTVAASGGVNMELFEAMCNSMRLGSVLAFNASNGQPNKLGVLASQNLSMIFLDDVYNDTLIAMNTEQLLSMPEQELFGLLVTSDAEGAPVTFSVMEAMGVTDVPFVGPWSGYSGLQSPFQPWVLNTLPTNFLSLTYAMCKFLASDLLLSRFAFVYPGPSLVHGVDLLSEVQSTLGLLGLRIVSSYGLFSFSADNATMEAAVANVSLGNPQAVIMVVGATQISQFILTAKRSMPSDVIYILDGSVSNNITNYLLTPEERSDVYLVFPVPLLTDTSVPIVSQFWRDYETYAGPEAWPSYEIVEPGALEGYINARWIASVFEGIRGGQLSRTAFLDAVYQTPIHTVGGITMGPFYDDCSSTGCQACCNAGSRKIYLVQFPNGTLEYVPNANLEWQSCFPQPSDVEEPFKFGQSASLTGSESDLGTQTRYGLVSAFAQTNDANSFNGRQMVLISYDDQSLPPKYAVSNYGQLSEMDNVLALTGLQGYESLSLALNASAPLVGISTGSPSLLNSGNFDRRLVSITGSSYEEMAGALDYFVTSLSYSSVGIYYESTTDGGLTRDGLAKALALQQMSIQSSIAQGEALPDSSSSSVQLWLVYNPTGELVLPFVKALSSATSVCVLSSLDPDLLVANLTAAGLIGGAKRSVDAAPSIYFTSSLPNPNPAGTENATQLVAEYQTALASFDSSIKPGYASLSGYLSGSMLASLISTVNGQVTSSSLLSSVYASGLLQLADLSLGVYYDQCNSTGIPCCNKGARSVNVVSPSTNGSWSTRHTFSYSQCSITFDAASISSQSDQALSIALGVSLPVGALIICLVLTALVMLVMLLRKNGHQKQEYNIDAEDLELGDLLGKGGFGEVYKATWKGTEVAVKMLPSENISKEAKKSFSDEVEIMSRLRHPNVILFMAASTQPPRLCIVMEYMTLGSLYDLLHNELIPDLPLALQVKLAHQAAKGMHFLHSSDIVHRDLKSLNLLLDSKWNLKVADFGLTKFKDSVRTKESQIGSVHWSAPEVLADLETDYMLADVYSFGIILWELLTREQPYYGLTPAQIAVAVIRNDLRPELPDSPSENGDDEYMELMTTCWHRDPTVRPTFELIIQKLSTMVGISGTSSSSSSSSAAYSSQASLQGSDQLRSGSRDGSQHSSSGKSEYASTASSSEETMLEQYRRSVPRKNVAYAVCDLSQMDLLWQSNPNEAYRIITAYGQLVRTHADKGRIFSGSYLHSGGTFFVAFFSPEHAASFALAVLAATNRDEDLRPISRIALHYRAGTNTHVEGDHTGTTYDKPNYQEACRISVLCWPGAVLCSKEFSDACAKSCLELQGLYLRAIPDVSHRQLLAAAPSDDEEEQFVVPGPPFSASGGLCSSNSCPWMVNGDKLTTGELIGKGTYGHVHEGTYYGAKVAVKQLVNARLSDESMRRTRLEAALHFKLDHPNVVKLLGLSIRDGEFKLVMELVSGGNLRNLLDSPRELRWADKISILKDAACGLAYLHNRNIKHRDIKSSNLLVDKDTLLVKVADFGFATAKVENSTMTSCGTPAWTAPEVFEQKKQGRKADVYSFGIVMWEVLTRDHPYRGINMFNIIQHVNAGNRPPIPADCPSDVAKMINKCWKKNPNKRPTMDDVLIFLNQTAETLSV